MFAAVNLVIREQQSVVGSQILNLVKMTGFPLVVQKNEYVFERKIILFTLRWCGGQSVCLC